MEFATRSQPESLLLERIQEGLSHDPTAKNLMELARDGKTRRFWLEGELLYTHRQRLYVPQHGNLQREVMKECHDSKWAGHPRVHRTLALLEDRFYWPHMGDDVETYVKTCLICQQDKVELKASAGLLQPLPIPERPWESLSMDFITGLLKSDGFASIFVVVDRFSKYVTFIPATKECPAEEAARLFLKHVVKYWGSPFEIVTGQQPLTPNAVATRYVGLNPAAYRFVRDWQEQNDLARACLHKASKRNKKWADRNRRDVQFQVGDPVLAKLHLILQHDGLHKGLVRRYEGPFRIVKKVGKVAYKLELPEKLKVHPVFHVSMLKPFHEDGEDPNRSKSELAPMGVKVAYDREVENIKVDRVVRRKYYRPRRENLVRWKGFPDSEMSWEPAEALWYFQDKIDRYHAENATRASLDLVGENVIGCAWEPASMTHLCDPSRKKEVIWPNLTGPPREELSFLFNGLPTLETPQPEVGSSDQKSTARRVVSGAPPAALENLEDRVPSAPGRTHNRIRSPR
ncbi:hypothetical protein V6Z11_A09G040800 [Gossypium hirsutum]